MVYLLGSAIVVAFIAVRYVTLNWKPPGVSGGRRNTPRAATLYAARSALSLIFLAATFAYLLLYAGETPALSQPVRGFAAIIPSAVGVFFSLLVLAQVAQANRLPEFLGLSTQRQVLFVRGMFALCRHPMYAGWLLAIWGLLLSKPYALTVVMSALLSLSFILEAVYEERAMIGAFGEYYRRYQAEVPFLVPYGFLKPKRQGEARLQPSAEPRPGPRPRQKDGARRGSKHPPRAT